MQPAITIVMLLVMGIAPILISMQTWASARALGFTPGRRALSAAIAFILLGGWFGLVLWGALDGAFVTPIRIYRVPVPIPHVSYLSLGPVIAGSLLVATSAATRALLDKTPLWRMTLIQTARLIGGVFLIGYAMGDIPGVFALPAGIGDVFIGLTAPIMAWLVATRGDRVRGLAIGWNILGILDLVDALTLGFLALGLRVFPGAQFSASGLLTAFPLVLIPGFGVPLTILVHIVTLRALRSRTETGARVPAGGTAPGLPGTASMD